MKLWDIGERRCIASYTMHSDSVWSIKASAGFDRIYSGGKLVELVPDPPAQISCIKPATIDQLG